MNGFSAMRHNNIRGLPANLYEFLIFLEEKQHYFSMIGISENWIENIVHPYGISDYDSFHNVLSCRRGCGLSILWRMSSHVIDVRLSRQLHVSSFFTVCCDYEDSVFSSCQERHFSDYIPSS